MITNLDFLCFSQSQDQVDVFHIPAPWLSDSWLIPFIIFVLMQGCQIIFLSYSHSIFLSPHFYTWGCQVLLHYLSIKMKFYSTTWLS